MALYKNLFLTALFVLASFSILPASASAQGANILVVDNGRVLRESVGGQDMARKIQAIGQTMATELEGEAAALETERRALEARTANQSREAIAADAALQEQAQGFQRKYQAFQAKQQKSRQELGLTEQNALTTFGQALDPVLQQVVSERGADLLFDRSVVTFASPTIDVTDLVIERMNASVPTISVTRARLPAEQAAPATIQ